jgi:hypothetical protein
VFADQSVKLQFLSKTAGVKCMAGFLKQRKIGDFGQQKPDADCDVPDLLNDVQEYFYVVPTPSSSSSGPGGLIISTPSPSNFMRRPQEGHS